MTPLLFLVGTLHLVGISIIVLAMLRAPYGYEDKKGFHAQPESFSDQNSAGSP